MHFGLGCLRLAAFPCIVADVRIYPLIAGFRTLSNSHCFECSLRCFLLFPAATSGFPPIWPWSGKVGSPPCGCMVKWDLPVVRFKSSAPIWNRLDLPVPSKLSIVLYDLFVISTNVKTRFLINSECQLCSCVSTPSHYPIFKTSTWICKHQLVYFKHALACAITLALHPCNCTIKDGSKKHVLAFASNYWVEPSLLASSYWVEAPPKWLSWRAGEQGKHPKFWSNFKS